MIFGQSLSTAETLFDATDDCLFGVVAVVVVVLVGALGVVVLGAVGVRAANDTEVFLFLAEAKKREKKADRQRQTDRQTDNQTDRRKSQEGQRNSMRLIT